MKVLLAAMLLSGMLAGCTNSNIHETQHHTSECSLGSCTLTEK